MAGRRVTGFGGSGFLGRRIALRLAADDPEMPIAVLDVWLACPASWKHARIGRLPLPGARFGRRDACEPSCRSR